MLDMNQEWVDLELLLRGLNELGARPLLMSMPIHGGWYDRCGITYAARRAYYEKLRRISARHHAPVVNFADHDADRSFCHDTMGHLAPAGLVYYNEVFDGFFHDAIPIPSELPASSRASGAGLPEENQSLFRGSKAMSRVDQGHTYPVLSSGRFARPWVRFVTLTLYYLGILVALVALYGQGDFSTPPFIYQNF